MTDDVHGRDIGGENDNAIGEGVGGERSGCRGGRFADRFDAFFHAALEGFGFGS